MRKSINGLAAIVESSFKMKPYEESVYVFCNRARDRIKILEWDGDGYWLYQEVRERTFPMAERGGRSDDEFNGRGIERDAKREQGRGKAEAERGIPDPGGLIWRGYVGATEKL